MVSGTQITQGEVDVMMGKLDVDDGAETVAVVTAPSGRRRLQQAVSLRVERPLPDGTSLTAEPLSAAPEGVTVVLSSLEAVAASMVVTRQGAAASGGPSRRTRARSGSSGRSCASSSGRSTRWRPSAAACCSAPPSPYRP